MSEESLIHDLVDKVVKYVRVNRGGWGEHSIEEGGPAREGRIPENLVWMTFVLPWGTGPVRRLPRES